MTTEDPKVRMVTPGQLAQMVGSRVQRALSGITGSEKPEEGPAFAFVMWVDGDPDSHWVSNRDTEELAQRLMGVLTALAEPQQDPQHPPPAIILPS